MGSRIGLVRRDSAALVGITAAAAKWTVVFLARKEDQIDVAWRRILIQTGWTDSGFGSLVLCILLVDQSLPEMLLVLAWI